MGDSVLDQHIEITPGIAGGKPRIAGRRITIQNIVVWYERMGKTVDEISAEYDLSLAEVHAALAYYFDHQAEIDAQMKSADDFVDQLKTLTGPGPLTEKLARRDSISS